MAKAGPASTNNNTELKAGQHPGVLAPLQTQAANQSILTTHKAAAGGLGSAKPAEKSIQQVALNSPCSLLGARCAPHCQSRREQYSRRGEPGVCRAMSQTLYKVASSISKLMLYLYQVVHSSPAGPFIRGNVKGDIAEQLTLYMSPDRFLHQTTPTLGLWALLYQIGLLRKTRTPVDAGSSMTLISAGRSGRASLAMCILLERRKASTL